MGNDGLSGKQVGSQASRRVTRRLAWIQPVCGSRTERVNMYQSIAVFSAISLCLQRQMYTEQNYQDLSGKYSELQSAKTAVEKELRDLRLALENETLNRNQVDEQTDELHGELDTLLQSFIQEDHVKATVSYHLV